MKRITRLLAAIMLAGVAATSATSAMAQSKGAKIFVIGGKADDPFWSKVKKGADDAGKVAELTGGSVTSSLSNPRWPLTAPKPATCSWNSATIGLDGMTRCQKATAW